MAKTLKFNHETDDIYESMGCSPEEFKAVGKKIAKMVIDVERSSMIVEYINNMKKRERGIAGIAIATIIIAGMQAAEAVSKVGILASALGKKCGCYNSQGPENGDWRPDDRNPLVG